MSKIDNKSKSKKTTKTIKHYKNLLKEINEKKQQVEDKNIRLLAEFDNFKKRIFIEKQESLKYEGVDIIKQILPMLDDFSRVLEMKTIIKDKSIYDGIYLLCEKLKGILNDNGVESYNSIGEEFDPNLHEAIMLKKSKQKKNIIIEEFQNGYKYHNRVIRHAKVIVSK